jgi:hypothetical protein
MADDERDAILAEPLVGLARAIFETMPRHTENPSENDS